MKKIPTDSKNTSVGTNMLCARKKTCRNNHTILSPYSVESLGQQLLVKATKMRQVFRLRLTQGFRLLARFCAMAFETYSNLKRAGQYGSRTV